MSGALGAAEARRRAGLRRSLPLSLVSVAKLRRLSLHTWSSDHASRRGRYPGGLLFPCWNVASFLNVAPPMLWSMRQTRVGTAGHPTMHFTSAAVAESRAAGAWAWDSCAGGSGRTSVRLPVLCLTSCLQSVCNSCVCVTALVCCLRLQTRLLAPKVHHRTRPISILIIRRRNKGADERNRPLSSTAVWFCCYGNGAATQTSRTA